MTQALIPPPPKPSVDARHAPSATGEEAIRPRLWTAERYMHMSELGLFDGEKVELIEGIIYDMAAQGVRHSIVIKIAQMRLDQAFEGIGFTLVQSTYLADEMSRPEPDLVVYPGKPQDYLKEGVEISEALLVGEVSLTTLSHDRKVKVPLYAKVGIREYWIVNLIANHLEVYREPMQDADGTWRYGEMQTLSLDRSVTPVAAPERVIAVRELMS